VQSGRPAGGVMMDVMHVMADEHDFERVAENGRRAQTGSATA
jgi:hypothetical protein